MLKAKNREEIIAEYHLGGITTRTLGLKYGYSFGTVAKWIRMGKNIQSKSEKLAASKQALAENERLPSDIEKLQEELRLSRLQVSLLEAMIDISDEKHGTNIRKKAGTRRS